MDGDFPHQHQTGDCEVIFTTEVTEATEVGVGAAVSAAEFLFLNEPLTYNRASQLLDFVSALL